MSLITILYDLSIRIQVTGYKPPTKIPPDKSHPDKSPLTISPLGLLKRLWRNMSLTLTCFDQIPPILKNKFPPLVFFVAFIPGVIQFRSGESIPVISSEYSSYHFLIKMKLPESFIFITDGFEHCQTLKAFLANYHPQRHLTKGCNKKLLGVGIQTHTPRKRGY